jgi:hypothetical protein
MAGSDTGGVETWDLLPESYFINAKQSKQSSPATRHGGA